MKQSLRLLKVIPLFMLLLANSCAEKPTEVTTLGGIEGIVYNASNSNPIPGATVTILDVGNRITLADGSYRFEELEEDIYIITASKSEYVTDTQSIEVVANRSKEVNFNLRAALPAQLLVTPTTLNFGELEPTLSLSVNNGGDEELSWQIASSQSWASIFPSTGVTTTETDAVSVTVNRSGLGVGEYSGALNFTSNGGDLSIPFSMTVPTAGLIVSTDSLIFGEQVSSLTFNISNAGNGLLSWELSSNSAWLSAVPESGSLTTSTETVSVSVDRTGLSPGDYVGSITISSNGGNGTVTVSMSVPDAPTPILFVDASELSFGASDTQLPLNLSNTGEVTLDWEISTQESWLTATPESGSLTTSVETVSITVDRTGLSPGDYAGSLSITSNGGDETVSVTISVPEPPSPILSVDTSELSFGASETQLSFIISNIGEATLDWEISTQESWITIYPTNGSTATEQDAIYVTVSRSELVPQEYSGEILITSNGGESTVSIQMQVPNHEDFETLDAWSNDGWQISSSPNCLEPPCALHYGDWSADTHTMSMQVQVLDGQVLSFWYYVYSAAGDLELFINDISMWTASGHGSGTAEVPLSGDGIIELKFVGSGPDYTSVYLDELYIQ
jgi:hypothetical protein